jgi:Na+/H+ antiporter NhaC
VRQDPPIPVTPPAAAASPPIRPQVRFYGGMAGAIAPFIFFVAGVVSLGLMGAPDERGFWPVLVGALTLGLLLARDRTAYCDAVIIGMSRDIVMIMVMAWLLASVLGVLLSTTGFIEALTWGAARIGLGRVGFVAATFLACVAVSTATGTSFGTILIAGPLLYPSGVLLGADPPTMIGAILGGAVFGDSISPISDTTIASAFSQNADIAGTVRSRVKYVVPAAMLSLVAYVASAAAKSGSAAAAATITARPDGLVMLAVPVVVIALLLAGRHLLHGLLMGLVVGTVVGLVSGVLPPDRVLSLDRENFVARSFIIDGITRGLGISVFTIFLLGLVSALEASGIVERVVQLTGRRMATPRAAEGWIVAVTTLVALLTTHSVVAILTVGEFAARTGARFGIHPYRRANLLDVTVCTFPFLLPYFIPVILAAGVTAGAADRGVPAVDLLTTGLHNFQSWALLLILLAAVATGYGRRFADDRTAAAGREVAASAPPA